MNTAAHIMGLDKLCGLYNIIRCNGGLAKLLRQLYRANNMKCTDWIEEALHSTGSPSECSRMNSEENCSFDAALMPARLLRWMNYLTNDCFLLVPAKRLNYYEQDLQLWKLHLSLSTPQIAPSLNIWDFFSVVLPPQRIEMTELFTSEDSDGRSAHYYLAITSNMDGSAETGDNVGGHLPRMISNSRFSNTASDAIYSSNDSASLREILTNRNLSTLKPNIFFESCASKKRACCTMKTENEAKLVCVRKKHIDCSSEVETESRKPRRYIRTGGASEAVQKSAAEKRTRAKTRIEKAKELHMKSKLGDDVPKAMEVSAEEDTKSLMIYKRKQNECNNMITDPKELAMNNKIINMGDKETNNLSNNAVHCSFAGRHSSGSDCKQNKPNITQQSTKDACGVKQEKQSGCSEKKESGCDEKRESGCGERKESGCGETAQKSTTCGGSSGKDEGTCVPDMRKKEHPCDRDQQKPAHHEVDSHTHAKVKEHFNKKMKAVRIKYKIEHCRRSKIIWGRSDFNKKSRKTNDLCSEK